MLLAQEMGPVEGRQQRHQQPVMAPAREHAQMSVIHTPLPHPFETQHLTKKLCSVSLEQHQVRDKELEQHSSWQNELKDSGNLVYTEPGQ